LRDPQLRIVLQAISVPALGTYILFTANQPDWPTRPGATRSRASLQQSKETEIMKTYLLSIALAVLAALSFGPAFAADEANQFDVNAVPHGTATRAEVKAELAQALRNGEIASNVETGPGLGQPVVATASTQIPARTSAEVRAEAVQAARAGHLPLADQTF
jgi:hypothetical protein